MSRTHRANGLDQLGPRHYAGALSIWASRWPSKPHKPTIGDRAAISTRNRKVKVTLPSLDTLNRLLERS